MGSSILGIGASGLTAANAGMLTTGHNIANAATPGYNRQQVFQSTNIPTASGAGFFGQGTNIVTVQRVYSSFLAGQVNTATSRQSELDTYRAEIAQLDNLLADPDAGLSPAMQEFFRTVQEVAANPSSIPARQSMLSGAQSLVARFKAIDQRVSEVRDGVNTQIVSTVAGINSMAGQIAELNQRITIAQAAVAGQPPNDLLDQRDQLITELNKLVRVTTSTSNDGAFNVFIGNGQALVVGTQVQTMTAVASKEDISRLEVGLTTTSGAQLNLQESMISGGALGGLLAFRRESLDPTQNQIGRIALSLAHSFNDQHMLGQDLLGTLGGAFFAEPQGQALASTLNNQAVGARVTVLVDDYASLTDSDYRLTYDGINYTLTRLSDATVWSNASLANLPPPGSPQGFTLSVSAIAPATAPAAGDSFLIQPTRSAARDIAVALADARNIAAAAPMRTRQVDANTGTAKIGAAQVSSTAALPAATTLTYQVPAAPATPGFSGFANGAVVTVTAPGGATSSYTSTGPGFVVPYSDGATIAFSGVSFTISGAPAAGDRFVVEPNLAGTADSRNALLLGQLQGSKVMLGGTASYQSAYAQTVSQVGNKSREVEVTLTAQENLLRQATDAMQSVSGVNLDEEAANLLRYQQAYQASARIMSIASSLFDELLGIGR